MNEEQKNEPVEIEQADVAKDAAALKKEQTREYQRQYRANNLEKLKAANIEWKLKNADKIKAERKTNAP